MTRQLSLGEIVVDVTFKDIKNVHLSVYPPSGRVKISAPLKMDIDTIRLFAIAKLGWIKKQQKKLREQLRETPREYLERESLFVWGKRYLLRIKEDQSASMVELSGNRYLKLTVRPGVSHAYKQEVISLWYRNQLRREIPALVAKWQKLIGIQVKDWRIKRMKTKWGSCSIEAGRIWLNLELAKKPVQCLEYIIAHEIAHFVERHHNDRFIAILDKKLPQWRHYRDELNAEPLAHEEWNY